MSLGTKVPLGTSRLRGPVTAGGGTHQTGSHQPLSSSEELGEVPPMYLPASYHPPGPSHLITTPGGQPTSPRKTGAPEEEGTTGLS